MKNLTLLIIATLLMQITAISQNSCLPEGITFHSQSQIDLFQQNYPGCIEIEGSVGINSTLAPPPFKINNLDGLSVITSIGGYLRIYYNDDLRNLQGLENLTSIGEDLSIKYNQSLTSLNQLTNLTFIGGDLNISSNYSLADCDAEWLCNYLSDPSGVVIINNASGCISSIQAAYSCGDSISCLPFGNYNFCHQSDVYNFQQVFPGCTQLKGIVEIDGSIMNLNGLNEVISIENLIIHDNNLLHNLTGLESLTTIEEDFFIYDNPYLDSLNGLVGLNTIGNNLVIRNNDYLTNLNSLENLTHIGGKLEVASNHNLSDITSLAGLLFVGNDLNISENDALQTLTGLNNITFINNSLIVHENASLNSLAGLDNLFSVQGVISISDNNSLQSLNGLSNLQTIGDDLEITKNDTMISLSGLDNLRYIGGDLAIVNNNKLLNLAGLESLNAIDSSLIIYGNDELVELSGLENLTYIPGKVQIGLREYLWDPPVGNAMLANLSGLQNLDSIGGSLCLLGNHSLQDLTGLEKLQYVGGALHITDNNSLKNLSGMENLNSIGDCLIIGNNDQLENLNGLENIYYFPGGVYIGMVAYYPTFNPSLTSLAGLNNLDSIGGSLHIIGSPILSDLTDLSNLKTIGGDLVLGTSSEEIFAGINVINNFHGLENLTSINGKLQIACNEGLTSLIGLENVAANSIQEISIYRNDSLSSCAVQSVCDYLAAPGANINIANNASGCINPEEVIDSCEANAFSVGELHIKENLTIYPNPANHKISLDLQPGIIAKSVEIADMQGKVLLHQKIAEGNVSINTANLPAGFYVVRIITNQDIELKKLIIQ